MKQHSQYSFRIWVIQTSIVISLVGLVGCRGAKPNSFSRTKIDNGAFIDKDSANKVDGVFYTMTTSIGASSGGACTGTAVSTNTAMTAAHCVYDSGERLDANHGLSGKQFCLNNSIYQKICSTNIFVNPGFPATAQGTSF